MVEKKDKKKKTDAKAVLERVYNVPLRKQWLKAPKYKRTKKAVTAVKQFVAKHMKAETVKIGRYLNMELWKHGIKNPPHHIKVNCIKDSEGIVKVEVVGAPKEEPKPIEKPKKKAEAKPKTKPEEKKEEEIEEKVKEIKEEKKEEAKEIEKEEIKELKKEHPKAHIPKGSIQPKIMKEHRREKIPGR